MIFNTLYESAKDGELIFVDGGMLRYHLRNDLQITIREILVLPEYQSNGIGKAMLKMMRDKHKEHTHVLAKCPIELEANQWYKAVGFTLMGTEKTRNGSILNLWRLDNA